MLDRYSPFCFFSDDWVVAKNYFMHTERSLFSIFILFENISTAQGAPPLSRTLVAQSGELLIFCLDTLGANVVAWTLYMTYQSWMHITQLLSGETKVEYTGVPYQGIYCRMIQRSRPVTGFKSYYKESNDNNGKLIIILILNYSQVK